MKSIALSIFLLISFANELQAQLNEYKYIVVPKQFDGFKRENQYKTSTLVKHLFTQKGFNTVYDDNLPEDLQANRCLGLFVNLDNQSSMFTTKTMLVLKDCSNEVIFSTLQGKSKKKQYEASFAEAIENAFRSFNAMPYSYEPKAQEETSEPITVSFKNDVKNLDERPNLNKNQDPLVEQEATAERQYYKDNRPVESDYKKAVDTTPIVVAQVATEKEQSFESMEPETASDYRINNTQESPSSSILKTDFGMLYAQELSNGYQLVDSTPKIRMKLLKSSSPNVYIAESGTINGLVFSENGKWFFEYYNGNELVTEELNIKF